MLAGTRSITGCHGNSGHCCMLTVSETLLDAHGEPGALPVAHGNQGCCQMVMVCGAQCSVAPLHPCASSPVPTRGGPSCP